MKKSFRMLALIGTVLAISLLSVVSVWAGPTMQGTVRVSTSGSIGMDVDKKEGQE